MLPYDGIEMWHGHLDLYMYWLEQILGTPDDSDIGYFVEVDKKYPNNIREKSEFSILSSKQVIPNNKDNDNMKKIILENYKKYTKSKKLLCDWTDKRASNSL